MKKLYKFLSIPIILGLVIGSLALLPKSVSASCGNGYSYCRTITIDHTKVGATTEDETYFPWEASSTIATIATVGNGGHVQNTTTETGSSYTGTVPADLIFTSDSACSTKLNWEFESYNSATGNFVAWIANSSTALSHTADTVVYMCYGKSSVTTWQGNVNGTWNTNYVAVYHFPTNSGSLGLGDSTSNAYNLTNHSASASTTASQIDGTVDTHSGYMTSPTITSVSGSMTISYWFNVKNAGNYQIGWSTGQIELWNVDGGVAPNNPPDFVYNGTYIVNGNNATLYNAWHLIEGTYDGTNGTLWVDGASSVGPTPASTQSFTSFTIGDRNGSTSYPLFGAMDEVRISKISLSAGWISTEYNNQSAPDKANYSSAGFYTVGSEQSGGGGGVTTTPVANVSISSGGSIQINKGGSLQIKNSN